MKNNTNFYAFYRLVPLISDIYLDIFVKAISNVCCPFTQLLEYINDVQESIKTNNLSLIILAFENIFKNCFITNENQEFKGKEFKTLDFFKDNLKLVFGKLPLNIFILYITLLTLLVIILFLFYSYLQTNSNHLISI